MAHEVKLTMDGLLINWLKDIGEYRQRERYHRRVRSRQSDCRNRSGQRADSSWNFAPSQATNWAKAPLSPSSAQPVKPNAPAPAETSSASSAAAVRIAGRLMSLKPAELMASAYDR